MTLAEPNPKGYELVQQNLDSNPKLKKLITAHKACLFGLSDSPERHINLYHPKGDKKSTHSAYWGKDGEEEGWTSICYPFAKWAQLAGVTVPTLIHLEMEGSESMLLSSFRQFLKSLEGTSEKPGFLFKVDRSTFDASEISTVNENVAELSKLYPYIYSSNKVKLLAGQSSHSHLTEEVVPLLHARINQDDVCEDCYYFFSPTPVEWVSPIKRVFSSTD